MSWTVEGGLGIDGSSCGIGDVGVLEFLAAVLRDILSGTLPGFSLDLSCSVDKAPVSSWDRKRLRSFNRLALA